MQWHFKNPKQEDHKYSPKSRTVTKKIQKNRGDFYDRGLDTFEYLF